MARFYSSSLQRQGSHVAVAEGWRMAGFVGEKLKCDSCLRRNDGMGERSAPGNCLGLESLRSEWRLLKRRHPREVLFNSRMAGQAGIQCLSLGQQPRRHWIPAFAGMTKSGGFWLKYVPFDLESVWRGTQVGVSRAQPTLRRWWRAGRFSGWTSPVVVRIRYRHGRCRWPLARVWAAARRVCCSCAVVRCWTWRGRVSFAHRLRPEAGRRGLR